MPTPSCQCPENTPNCKCDEASVIAKYAVNKSLTMVITALIGGFALAIALLFSDPITQMIANLGYTEIIASLISALIFFSIAIILVVLLIFLGRSNSKIKAIAKQNNYILE